MAKKMQICEIVNERGFHARPVALFVQTASAYESDISVKNLHSGETADGKSLMSLLILAAPKDTKLEITASGSDADTVLQQLSSMIAGGFNEE